MEAFGNGQEFVPTAVAYGLFFGALGATTAVAVLWPYLARTVKSYVSPGEEFASARGTQPWWSISCSFFSTSLGSWVLTAPPEIAQTYSLWGIVGYAVATSLPWLCVAFFGPRMRELTEGKGFSNIDFIKVRLGMACHVVYSLCSFTSVFLAFVVECVSLSQIIVAVSPNVKGYVLTTSVIVGVSLYTCVSGLQATLMTDRFQLAAIFALLVISSIGVFHCAANRVADAERAMGFGGSSLQHRMVWTQEGFVSLIVLTLACLFPTFLDPASWSRIYAARSERDAKVGLVVAAGLLMVPMLVFGFMGLVSGAALDDGLVSDASIFSTLTLLHPWWNGVMVLLATLLSTSTVDTISNTLTSFVVANFAAFNLRLNINLARLVTLALAVVCLVLVIQNPPKVMTLFMCCNLISAATASGLLLSLWDCVTPLGVLSGIGAGLLTVCTFGWSYYGTFTGGFDWWLLPEGSANMLALWTFLATGAISAIVTLAASCLHFRIDTSARLAQQAKFELLKRGGERAPETVFIKSEASTPSPSFP